MQCVCLIYMYLKLLVKVYPISNLKLMQWFLCFGLHHYFVFFPFFNLKYNFLHITKKKQRGDMRGKLYYTT